MIIVMIDDLWVTSDKVGLWWFGDKVGSALDKTWVHRSIFLNLFFPKVSYSKVRIPTDLCKCFQKSNLT